MNKKEQFKMFARKHPELITHIKSGNMNWQKFYEIYDIYGEDETVWHEYIANSSSGKDNLNLSKNIENKLKNVDMNSIQEHIKTAQKALSLVSELTTKNVSNASAVIPKVPRPINQFFED